MSDIKENSLTIGSYYRKKSYNMGILAREVNLKLEGKVNKEENLRDLREVVKEHIEPLDIPETYKVFLLNKYYSPLLNSKKLLGLWKNKNMRELRQFVKEKPVLWLKRGPFFYT